MAEVQRRAPEERRWVDVDRRKRPTPVVSRYWLRGRRRGGRRDGERGNIYVDRYSLLESVLIGGVAILSLLDMIFTIIHLERGGTEANPIMDWFLQIGGYPAFVAAKLATTVLGLLVLLVHIRFRRVKGLVTFAFVVYFALFVFHLYLFWQWANRPGA